MRCLLCITDHERPRRRCGLFWPARRARSEASKSASIRPSGKKIDFENARLAEEALEADRRSEKERAGLIARAAEAVERKRREEEQKTEQARQTRRWSGIVFLAFVLIVFCKWFYDLRYYGNMDCVRWEGGGCSKCSTSLAPLLPFKNLRASCSQCPNGWALMSGAPYLNHVFTSPAGRTFAWENHCAEMLPEKERRVLMIRHGQSNWNVWMEKTASLAGIVGLWSGKDSPLSSLGLLQAQRLANIVRKASVKVYGSKAATDATLSAARADLKDSLENKVVILNKSSRKIVTDEEMVQNLASPRNRDELDVLLGRKCGETNFVSSPLARAMDTLLVSTMERRLTCTTPWQISSNLQELEHNRDCEPNLKQGMVPAIVKMQRKEYKNNGIANTLKYVEAMYPKSDTSRHDTIKGSIGRMRWWDQSAQMKAELNATFSSQKQFSVWAGHSIWFRMFFQYFADLSNTDCKALTTAKLANTAMLSVRLRPLKNSHWKYAAFDCRFIHLGEAKQFHFER